MLPRYFLLAIAVLFSVKIFAQSAAFPIENARWCYAQYGDLGDYQYTYCIEPDSLLMLNGKTYSRIKSGPNTYLYREESRRLYAWPQDSAQEYLVYDFNLALGDTFQVQWGNINPGISHTLTVTQIDTIVTLPDNAVRKIMWLGNDEGALGNWIEGIGSPICDFLYPVYFLSVSGYCSLECFSIESVVLYPESGPGMTCPLNSGLANPANDLQFSVQPNPVMAERFDIQCPIKHPCKASFTLHNTFGQLITHSPSQFFSGEEIRFTVEAADLVNGLYFLRFNTESGTATKTIVIQR